MSLTKKLALPALATGMLANSQANGSLYDDFSSGSLNSALWIETTIPANIHGNYPLFNEHFVNPITGKYQAGQYAVGNRSIRLVPTRQLVTGETLDYDITHIFGEGNHLSHLYVNDALGVYQNQPNYLAGPGIGYWNDIPDTGNQIGNYHAH